MRGDGLSAQPRRRTPRSVMRAASRGRKRGGDGLVHEHRLDGIAGGGIVRFGVVDDVERHVEIRGSIDVDVADAFGMAQHGDARIGLDVAHQRRTSRAESPDRSDRRACSSSSTSARCWMLVTSGLGERECARKRAREWPRRATRAVRSTSRPGLRITALADLMASEAICVMASGRASKMTASRPSGQLTFSSSRPESSSVRSSTRPMGSGKARRRARLRSWTRSLCGESFRRSTRRLRRFAAREGRFGVAQCPAALAARISRAACSSRAAQSASSA